MKLVAKYALSYLQAVEGELPHAMWDELLAWEQKGYHILHSEDPVRRVLTYEVYEREAGEPSPQAWDSVLAAQLRASLVVENERLRSSGRKRVDAVLRGRDVRSVAWDEAGVVGLDVIKREVKKLRDGA